MLMDEIGNYAYKLTFIFKKQLDCPCIKILNKIVQTLDVLHVS